MMAIRKKLFIAALSMLIAIALMVSASLAWFTVSTSPEVGGMQVGLFSDRTLLLSLDNNAFQQYISLSNCFANMTPLRPVSTADGLNWFIPAYRSDTGELLEPSAFIRDTTLRYANVSTLSSVTDEYGNRRELTGAALRERSNKGYYVYAEFWMKTEEENGCNVRLSVPGTTELDSSERETGVYGTYSLGTCELVDGTDEQGEPEIRIVSSSKFAETAMRVGFLVNPSQMPDAANNEMVPDPDHSDDYESDVFFIYEPNAEKRSSDNKPLQDEENEEVNYVIGYEFNIENYVDGMYFETEPIGVRQVTTVGKDGTEAAETLIQPVRLDASRLIVQTSSQWDSEALISCLSSGKRPNSNQVQLPMGGFLNTGSVYEALSDGETESCADVGSMSADIAGSNVIVKLEQDKPVKIRMFVWIEGQDVDCWNDIAAGSFLVNLELAGESIIKED